MGDVVTVGCKLPSGLALALPGRTPVRLNGFSVAVGVVPAHEIAGGFGLTLVDADFWAEWMAKIGSKGFDPVDRGFVFATPRPDRTRDAAAERRELVSGLEPIDPNKPGGGLEPVWTPGGPSPQGEGPVQTPMPRV